MTVVATALPLVDLRVQHETIKEELDEALGRVVASNQFVLGPEVRAFEEAFASYCGVGHAIACGNGTDALEMALWAVGVGPGDEVITPSMTFGATAEAIVRAGAVPRFVDVQAETLLLDCDAVEEAISTRTRAIIPVHLYGACADMPRLMDIARRHGIPVVEDAAQASGARTPSGAAAGAVGTIGAFSFYPGKNLGAWGDAGALVTNDDRIASRLRQLRDHGRTGKYEHDFCGRNSRMDGIQAAVLAVKLRHLDEWNAQRRSAAVRYRRALGRVVSVRDPEEGIPVHHLFVIRSPADKRDVVATELSKVSIATGIHYPIPLHQQPAFQSYHAGLPALAVTERASREVLSLPMFPELTEEQVDRVASAVVKAIG